ncbi:MAG: hypothetical protein LBR52_06170 [Prevotellaceae bacterium]|jgi:uncharacterized membrane protein|nr:hypothetical protein [Prevotellaceae bacterium]
MAWYEIMLLLTGGLFVISSILSLLFGELDMDFDSGTDAILSDIISFKGLLHFCIGFSLVLTLMREVTVISVACGVITGMIFSIVLFFLYKFIYEKAQQHLQYTENIHELDAEVYFWDKTSRTGEVFVSLEGRPVTISIRCPECVDLQKGQKLKVSGTRKLVYPSETENQH